MVNERKKSKYEALHDLDRDENDDMVIKKKLFTPVCLWSSIYTAFLISTYFIPSIGLTFYQRWFLQVNLFNLAYLLT